MFELGVIGGPEFVLGFQLAGITKTVEVDQSSASDKVREIKADPNMGIIIIDQSTVDNLKNHERDAIERSVKPVFLTLSTETSQENLRKMIMKSIGVDLWKD